MEKKKRDFLSADPAEKEPLDPQKKKIRYRKIIPIILAVIVIAILLLRSCSCDGGILQPDGNIEEASEEATSELQLTVELPDGESYYDGTIEAPGEEPGGDAYTGRAHLNVTMPVNGEEHTLADYDTRIKKGEIPDFTIDFTILDFELVEGTDEEGTLTVTYADGTVEEKPIQIFIRQPNSGSMEIQFSPDVTVNLNSGAISCDYETNSDDTHDTVVQLVLLNGGKEYVLAESETLKPGDSLTSMTLDAKMKKRLTEGVYSGYLRLNFYNDSDQDASASVQTNIEADITVTADGKE